MQRICSESAGHALAGSHPHPHRACPHPPQLGIEVVDTYSSGLRHPELSADGVHFPGALRGDTLHTTHAHILGALYAHCGCTARTVCAPFPGALSRQHAQEFLRTVCDPPTNNQFVEAFR